MIECEVVYVLDIHVAMFRWVLTWLHCRDLVAFGSSLVREHIHSSLLSGLWAAARSPRLNGHHFRGNASHAPDVKSMKDRGTV